MNLYKVLAIILLVIILGNYFNIAPSIEMFFSRISDIPKFEEKGSNPALYNLVVRLAYLIAILGALKLFFIGSRDDD